MRRRFGLLIGTLLLAAAIAPGSVAADTSAKFDYHIADAFIQAGTGEPQTGARAQARNRDTVSVVGTGTFNVASGTATGGGSFEHRDKKGNLLGSGTWTATGVQSFTFWGCSEGPPLPPNFCGGLLVLNVHLVGAGDGILTVSCRIGANVPAGAQEGITLEIPGVINFDKLLEEASGLTLYVSRSKN